MKLDSKIYVAGHIGLVGSSLMSNLKKKGFSNIVTRSLQELDLKRQADTEAFFDSEKPEYVFLAAAKVGGIHANNTYKAQFIYDNIIIASNVINSAHRYGVKKLLNFGSSCIYPRSAPQPLEEECLLTGPLEKTNEPYAVAKIAAIKMCRYYNEEYGSDFVSVMPTNLYGPNDNFNLETSHVLPALLRKFHLAKLTCERNQDQIKKDIEIFGKIPADLPINKDKVLLWGTGSPLREFLYSDDLAEACIMIMEKYSAKDIGEFVNIGAGKDITIKEIAEIVSETVGFSGDISWDASKPDGTPKKLMNISRIKKLGWQPKIDIRTGLKKYYKWYLEKSGLKPNNIE
jgi:GDP-L-fucose synthase